MYFTNEISQIKSTWVSWLASFQKNEVRVINPEDKARIAVSITANFHSKKIAKFKIKTINGETTVTRIS